MDKKELGKEGKGAEITYEIESKELPVVNKARAAYIVDADAEYEKFLNLPEMTRAEFIDGKIYYLGEPSLKHQELSIRLSARFHNYLHGKSCRVYAAPFGVKIDFDFDPFSKNTLQPDLLVICDSDKLDEKGLNGTPDLVIEILSPSNFRHDKIFKYNKYRSVGVKEYWIVDPIEEEVSVNILNSDQYVSRKYIKGDIIKVSILDNLYINVTDLFEGYKGAEIVEVEMARKEERMKAEAKQFETAKKLFEIGLSIEQIVETMELDFEVVQKLIESNGL